MRPLSVTVMLRLWERKKIESKELNSAPILLLIQKWRRRDKKGRLRRKRRIIRRRRSDGRGKGVMWRRQKKEEEEEKEKENDVWIARIEWNSQRENMRCTVSLLYLPTYWIEQGRIHGIRCVLARTDSNFDQKRHFCMVSTRVWPTDWPSDRPTDGQTYPLIEMRERI